MAKVINLKDRVGRRPDNLIASSPWEFRRPYWQSQYFIQVLKAGSAHLERQKREAGKRGCSGAIDLPPHAVLSGGAANTVRALFGYKDNEPNMREIYYLAGLMDCMINQVNPLLRTDQIRNLYKKVMTMKGLLGMNLYWAGSMDRVLLPLDGRFFNHPQYRATLSSAGSMKTLYLAIREGTETMFDILAREYVFYTPGRGGHNHGRRIR